MQAARTHTYTRAASSIAHEKAHVINRQPASFAKKGLGGHFSGAKPREQVSAGALAAAGAREEPGGEDRALASPWATLGEGKARLFAAKSPVQGPSAAGNAVRVGMGTWGWCQMLASIMHRAMVTGGVSITVPQPQAPLAQPMLPNTHTPHSHLPAQHQAQNHLGSPSKQGPSPQPCRLRAEHASPPPCCWRTIKTPLTRGCY